MFTLTTVPAQQNRAFDDILAAEKTQRLAAEKDSQDLRDLLNAIAIRLDGERLEQAHRDNSNDPACWRLEEWKLFFSSIRPARRITQAVWDENSGQNKLVEENAQLRMALKSVQDKLTAADAELKRARSAAASQHFEHKEKHRAVPAPVPGQSGQKALVVDEALLEAQAAQEPLSYAGMVVDLRKFAQNVPALPEAYKALGENGRAWDRYALAIHLLGKWGIAARVEIIGILGRAVVNKSTGALGVGEGSGSLKGILERLEEYGYVCMGKLGMEKIGIGLNFYRLTPEGEVLYQAVEQEKPVESEWARLNRLHEGERFEEHTAACLAFAMHARRRGWGARVLPELEGRSVPDVVVLRNDERINVEVELSTGREEKTAKWKNLAEANSGFVALCAATAERRERFILECRAEHLPGMATDLKTLVTPYDKVALDAELWASTW